MVLVPCAIIVAILKGELGGLHERPIGRVDFMVGAVLKNKPNSDNLVAGKMSLLTGFFECFFDGGNEILRHVGAERFVFELEEMNIFEQEIVS